MKCKKCVLKIEKSFLLIKWLQHVLAFSIVFHYTTKQIKRKKNSRIYIADIQLSVLPNDFKYFQVQSANNDR
jgi:hypothetical protein